MYSLKIHAIPELVFGREISHVGQLDLASDGVSPTLEVAIDNTRGEATSRMTPALLGARASLSEAASGAALFRGRLQAIELGSAVTLTLEL